MGKPFDPKEVKTDGIEILHWDVHHNERTIKLNIWDLGGQEIYHATHQFFLTERTLYILVLNSRQSEAQNRLDYWLKTIRGLGKDAPIFVVQNQFENNPPELNRKYLQGKYSSIQRFFQTSCADLPRGPHGINELRDAIINTIAEMDHVCDLLPGRYFQVKEAIENIRRDYMTYQEYEDLCVSEGLDDSESQKILVKLLHELGIALNFDDFRLRDTNVLNPEWVTDGVYKIIDNQDLRKKGDAVLDIDMLSSILPKNRYPFAKQRFIIEMMEKFELCFKQEGKDTWLIPELLAPAEPDYTGDYVDSLLFEYHYDLLPSSVLPRFIVRTNNFRQTYYWRDGVVIEDDNNRARIRADIDSGKILIEVNGSSNTRRDLLSKIRGQFDHINHTLQGMNAQEMIPVPEYPDAKPVSYNFLLQLENDNEMYFRCENVSEKLKVSDLLDGIECNRVKNKKSNIVDEGSIPTKTRDKSVKTNFDFDKELRIIRSILNVSEYNESYIKQLSIHVQKNKIIPFVGAGMSSELGFKMWGQAMES